jgi:hypothetical protein
MNKSNQILIAVAFPILLAGLLLIVDYICFPPAISQGVSFCLFCTTFKETRGLGLGGTTYVSEILRLIALCLFLIAPVMPTFIKYLQKPIKRTELNLTDKLI